MESKEREWHKKRIGRFTSSSLHRLMSASGKFIDGNITYLLEIERERFLGEPTPIVTSVEMRHGLINEKYAVEWIRDNTSWDNIVYAQELDDIPFKTTEYMAGASYDVFYNYIGDRIDKLNYHIDIKCPHSQKELCFYFSESIPYKEKRKKAFEQHCHQMAGQLLCDENLENVGILKYDAQRDDNEFDLRSPLDKSRGIAFIWKRSDFNLDIYKKRIIFANDYLNSGKSILNINKEWEKYNNTQ